MAYLWRSREGWLVAVAWQWRSVGAPRGASANGGEKRKQQTRMALRSLA
jgi:hypothetical protein